jgi:hypothetical protein
MTLYWLRTELARMLVKLCHRLMDMAMWLAPWLPE